jgi:UDP-N-acetylglucosamine--N-acetylmuramyl-(pentapeptide) pyrophosphoryl-undecaprenol N-acetylglucosamine transferase
VRILIACGASGGHIFPALSFAQELKALQPQAEVTFLLPRRARIRPEGFNACFVSTLPLRLSPLPEAGASLFCFLKGFLQSLILMARLRPQLAAGFGGIETIAPLIWAWLFRVKTLVHEQNVIPGKANRLLSLLADKTAVSFAATQNQLGAHGRRVIFSGNPLRPELKRIERREALRFFGWDDPRGWVILAMGGSQGSQRLNAAFARAIIKLQAAAEIKVIHLCGRQDRQGLEGKYKAAGIAAKVIEFLPQMEFAYSAADIVVSRAGALAISEIIFYRLPAVLVPYPYAGRHQQANAGLLTENGCALLVKDEGLESGELGAALGKIIEGPMLAQQMRAAYVVFSALPAGPGKILARAALSLIEE